MFVATDPVQQVQAETVPEPPATDAGAAAWIRDQWGAFVELWPRILGLQHRAAELAATLPAGSYERTAARWLVTAAGELADVQRRTQKVVETYAGALGLGAVGAVPVVGAAIGFAALAAVIVWTFRRYDALDAMLERIDRGSLTPEQATGLLDAAGPMPDVSVLGAGVGGAVLGIVLAGVALWWFARRRPNPWIVAVNPPEDVWSHRVMRVDYIHDDDGRAYRHDFGRGVRMEAEEDGSVRLWHPSRRIWREF